MSGQYLPFDKCVWQRKGLVGRNELLKKKSLSRVVRETFEQCSGHTG